ncbi:MAG: AMP-binding protein [Hyphomicrobiales bacterium]|nr:AMP-binding protein [Hyphomicrobiales bacterium]
MTKATGARPWLAFYPTGAPSDITEAPFRTLAELVSASARLYGGRTAYTVVMPNGMYGDLSFADVDRMADAFAVYLREVLGLKAGDRVALQAPNSLPVPVVAFGVFKAGCVLVNVNPLYTAEEMGAQFRDATPRALVIVDMFADKLTEAMKICAIPNVIVTRVPEFMPGAVKGVIGLVQRYWDRSLPPIETPHIRLPDALAAGAKAREDGKSAVESYTAGLDGSALAALQYTGGTTGISKGAMLTHGNIVMNMAQTMSFIDQHVKKGEEVVLTAIPTYHILAFTLNLLGFYWLGNRNILIPNPRPLSNLKRAFENYPITWIVGVNTLFNGLMNEFWFAENPPRHLRASFAGGAALQGAVAERWLTMTGTHVIEGYGLTETSPVITGNPVGKARVGSVGIPVPSTEVMLLDDEGRPVPPGEAGEVCVRGPQVMAGYWQRPDETARSITADGFFRTGDIGTMDPDGYFRIVDRKKDMILVSGFNVYPNEVEDCLARLPGIAEAAVIGVPDGAAGEAVKAFIVPLDKALTAEEVKSHCKQHLAAYKCPKLVEFRAELPKSNVGKILRKDLKSAELALASQSKGA